MPHRHDHGQRYHQGRDAGRGRAEEIGTEEGIREYIIKCEGIALRNEERGSDFAKNEYRGRADGAREFLYKDVRSPLAIN